jgi:hypothetical protein
VLAQSLWILLIGLTIDVGVSLALSRLLESLLFQVDPRDLATLSIVSALLVAVALVRHRFRRAVHRGSIHSMPCEWIRAPIVFNVSSTPTPRLGLSAVAPDIVRIRETVWFPDGMS